MHKYLLIFILLIVQSLCLDSTQGPAQPKVMSETGGTGSAHGSDPSGSWGYNWGWGSGPGSGWGYGSGSAESPSGSGHGSGFGFGSGTGTGSGSGYGSGSGGGGDSRANGYGFGRGHGSNGGGSNWRNGGRPWSDNRGGSEKVVSGINKGSCCGNHTGSGETLAGTSVSSGLYSSATAGPREALMCGVSSLSISLNWRKDESKESDFKDAADFVDKEHEDLDEDLDYKAVENGFVAVTPLKLLVNVDSEIQASASDWLASIHTRTEEAS